MSNENILERCKKISYINYAIMAMAFASTSPVIHSYMISNISTDFYKVSCFVSELVGVIIYYVLDIRNKDDKPIIIIKMRKHLVCIVVLGVICLMIANASYLIDIRARFILISLTQGILGCIWKNCMCDLWNLSISGTELTIFDIKSSKFDRLGAIIGATAILFIDMDVNTGLVIQILAYITLAICDIYVYIKLKKIGIYSKEEGVK